MKVVTHVVRNFVAREEGRREKHAGRREKHASRRAREAGGHEALRGQRCGQPLDDTA